MFSSCYKKDQHLIFREFTFKDETKEGMMKIKEPPIKSIIIPELFLYSLSCF